eukprot:6469236-Amphidinium_carterae.2
MGGLPPAAATATAKTGTAEETPGVAPAPDTGGVEGSTDRQRPLAETPEDLPEEGEQESAARCGRCAAQTGEESIYWTSHDLTPIILRKHSKGCLRFRQSVNADPEFAARVGLTPEQVQMSRDRGLLRPVGQTGTAETPEAASGVARAPTEVAGGAAIAVSGTASETVTANGASD